jgi:ParB family chromosome partitioning protein
MKMDALKHQGKKLDAITSCKVGTKSRTDANVADADDISARTVQRFIRLTNLIKPLLDMVDEKRIAMSPAVELSYLPEKNQKTLLSAISAEACTPSLSQALRMKEAARGGKLTDDTIFSIMAEQKPNQREKISLRVERLREYFPKSYSAEQMEKRILKLLEADRKRQQEHKPLSSPDR